MWNLRPDRGEMIVQRSVKKFSLSRYSSEVVSIWYLCSNLYHNIIHWVCEMPTISVIVMNENQRYTDLESGCNQRYNYTLLAILVHQKNTSFLLLISILQFNISQNAAGHHRLYRCDSGWHRVISIPSKPILYQWIYEYQLGLWHILFPNGNSLYEMNW